MRATAAQSGKTLVGPFHALSDETRLRIVQLLRGSEHCVCELTEALKLTQSLLSFHLKVLKEAGLVRYRRQGRWAYYTLDPDSIAALAGFLGELAKPEQRRSRSPRCRD